MEVKRFQYLSHQLSYRPRPQSPDLRLIFCHCHDDVSTIVTISADDFFVALRSCPQRSIIDYFTLSIPDTFTLERHGLLPAGDIFEPTMVQFAMIAKPAGKRGIMELLGLIMVNWCVRIESIRVETYEQRVLKVPFVLAFVS